MKEHDVIHCSIFLYLHMLQNFYLNFLEEPSYSQDIFLLNIECWHLNWNNSYFRAWITIFFVWGWENWLYAQRWAQKDHHKINKTWFVCSIPWLRPVWREPLCIFLLNQTQIASIPTWKMMLIFLRQKIEYRAHCLCLFPVL